MSAMFRGSLIRSANFPFAAVAAMTSRAPSTQPLGSPARRGDAVEVAEPESLAMK
jgi:hypothetical protein